MSDVLVFWELNHPDGFHAKSGNGREELGVLDLPTSAVLSQFKCYTITWTHLFNIIVATSRSDIPYVHLLSNEIEPLEGMHAGQ